MIVSRGSFRYTPYRKAGEKVRKIERENENEKSEKEKAMKEEKKEISCEEEGEIFKNDLKKKKNKEFTIVQET